MKRYWYILLLFTCCISLSRCGDRNEDILEQKPPVESEAAKAMREMWETSPLSMNTLRQGAFVKIQQYADNCSMTYFKNYLKSMDSACESMEKNNPVLTCYRMAFDRVLEGVKNEQVEEGTAVVWILYNMGYVVKTPSGCFGIDIYHRWAKKLAPYLNFLCVTHNHTDHYSTDLIQAMFDANKPVLSNYLKKGTTYAYTSTTNNNYVIGKFAIRTAITDHNETADGRNFVTVFRINCGDDTGNFTLLHVGDFNYRTVQFANMEGTVDVLIPRYAPVPHGLDENNIIGDGAGQVQPDCILLSHILELGH
ncbi:MAG: MBL fold metallo-hydrolase, partial [Dysgonamonadaceae bacterium]|nr:MBL fold metallo-hydrolase [Dysgonamonadaceae bacterium]